MAQVTAHSSFCGRAIVPQQQHQRSHSYRSRLALRCQSKWVTASAVRYQGLVSDLLHWWGKSDPIVLHRSEQQTAQPPGRRGLLLAFTLAAAQPLCWKTNAQEAFGRGKSDLGGLKDSQPASYTCPTGDDGIDCKLKILREDKMGDYPSPGTKSLQAVTGVPVAEMKDDYTKATYALTDALEKYITLDPYDKERLLVVKSIKENARLWAGKYAPGGSARKQSARRFYIAVDAVQGHLVAYGLSPYPKNRVGKIRDSIDETRALLQKNK